MRDPVRSLGLDLDLDLDRDRDLGLGWPRHPPARRRTLGISALELSARRSTLRFEAHPTLRGDG